MTSWAEHVAAALLGTQRRQPPPLPAAAGETGDQAARLLAQAALLTVRQRAGRRPGWAEPVAPAPAETAPVVPPAAARRLERMLAGEQARVLPEWLAAAALAGYRVPAATLPDLLDRGRVDRALRPLIARAAGRRAMWLALRNTEWAYLVGEPAAAEAEAAEVVAGAGAGDQDVWETGTRSRRLAHLERLRATEPGAALTALRGTWQSEPAADRAAFLATFERGIGPADEQFLEEALADRAKDVRQLAADLLARLPGSAYGRRMAERAAACLRVERRTSRFRERSQPWIVVDPPRDGGVGALREVLAHTPLGTWTALFGLQPGEIVRLPISADHGDDVHIGWARAATLGHDAEWARALLDGGAVTEHLELTADLLGVLPAAEQEAAAVDLLRRSGGHRDLMRILDRIPGPWAGGLAEAVLGLLADTAGRADAARHLGRLARLAEARLSPDVAGRLVEITRDHDTWPLTELAETLRFRHDMLEELA